MAYKLIWSTAARDDLHDIVVIIGSMTAKESCLKLFDLLPNDCSQEEFTERTA